jgi:very-short-patch-repair endonuclease
VVTQLFDRVSERGKRRSLRNNMPKAEIMVWELLRNRQVDGYRFRRQYSVGAFMVDFCCPELKLAIEVDGDSHLRDGAPEYDADRQLFLEAKGIRVLRIRNEQVYKDVESAISLVRSVMGEMQGFDGGSERNDGFSSPLIKATVYTQVLKLSLSKVLAMLRSINPLYLLSERLRQG